MTTILIAVAIGALLAFLIPMANMKAQLKTVNRQSSAANYVREGSMRVHQQRDIFLYRNVVRTPKPKNNASKAAR